ncbi:MAG: class I SAM-dependent methyltransferase [Acidobacteria bacterium]|nr:class I SAM-dependent methyltransferase [Acidobacteriota bacterium]
MPTLRDRFEEIYRSAEWGGDSGEGSRPIYTKGYVEFLNTFLKENAIKSVVDLGCGDWQFSRSIDWGPAAYLGVDVARPIVDANRKMYSRANVRFEECSGDPKELPPADLLLVKDVLQHLSYTNIDRVLASLSNYKFSLITNCVDPKKATVNRDIEDGDFRYLDLRLEPFLLEMEEVFNFERARSGLQRFWRPPYWRKEVLLVRNSTAKISP